MKERLARQAPVARPDDEMTQRYSYKFWPISKMGEPSLLVYNRDRNQFEKTDDQQALVNFLNGLTNKQSMKEFLVDSRRISERYGKAVGVWYAWEYFAEKVADRERDLVRSGAEFIYYKVPYGYNIPFIEKLID